MAKKTPEPDPPNLTPMIDIVFQMIIFFVFTADLDKASFDKKIELPLALDAVEIDEYDPRTIHIKVDSEGDAIIGRIPYSDDNLRNVLRNAAAKYGDDIPVIIRGARFVKHRSIGRVMDVVTSAGLYKISFAAIKQKVT